MKKLFFAALVATVAVGGALSANAVTIFPKDSDQGYACEELTTPTCLSNIPSGQIYEVSASSNQQGPATEIDRDLLVDYTYLGPVN